MNSSKKQHAIFQGAATIVILAALLATYFYAQSKPLDKGKLKVIVGEFRSSASEGNLLSDQIKQRKVDSTYAYEHIGMMMKSLDKNLKSLKKSQVQPDLVSKKEQTVKLAQDLKYSLTYLQSSAIHSNEILLSQDLKQLFGSLEEIENSLE